MAPPWPALPKSSVLSSGRPHGRPELSSWVLGKREPCSASLVNVANCCSRVAARMDLIFSFPGGIDGLGILHFHDRGFRAVAVFDFVGTKFLRRSIASDSEYQILLMFQLCVIHTDASASSVRQYVLTHSAVQIAHNKTVVTGSGAAQISGWASTDVRLNNRLNSQPIILLCSAQHRGRLRGLPLHASCQGNSSKELQPRHAGPSQQY
jgi:hypothetical protein